MKGERGPSSFSRLGVVTSRRLPPSPHHRKNRVEGTLVCFASDLNTPKVPGPVVHPEVKGFICGTSQY